jgi:Divergent InlB B-repeat domain
VKLHALSSPHGRAILRFEVGLCVWVASVVLAAGQTFGGSEIGSRGSGWAYYRTDAEARNAGDRGLGERVVPPVSNLKAIRFARDRAWLTWDPPAEPVAGYYVYGSTDSAGPFTRKSREMLTASSFLDRFPTPGEIYVVQALLREERGGLTYWNASQGVFRELDWPRVQISLRVPQGPDLGASVAEVILTRTGLVEPPLAVICLLSGKAVNGGDYQTQSRLVTFAAGSRTASWWVRPEEVAAEGPVHTIRVTLGNGPGYTRGRYTDDANSVTALVDPGPAAFLPYRGDYVGLVQRRRSEAAGVAHVRLAPTGRFTAAVQLGTRVIRGTGCFDRSGVARFPVPGEPGIRVALTCRFGSSQQISGGVGLEGELSDGGFVLSRGPKPPQEPEIPGAYVLALDPGNKLRTSGTAPEGAGWAWAKMGRSGRVRVAGLLADQTPFSAGSSCWYGNQALLFASLYGGQGSVSGPINFGYSSGDARRGIPAFHQVDGVIGWRKPALPVARFFPGGFSTEFDVRGCRRASQAKGQPALDYANVIGNAKWRASGGGLATPIEKLVTVAAPDAFPVVAPDVDDLQIRSGPMDWMLSGSFFHPALRRRVPFTAVILPTLFREEQACGHFLGDGVTGFVTLNRNQEFLGSGGYDRDRDRSRPAVTIVSPPPDARIAEREGFPRDPIVTVRGNAQSPADILVVRCQLLHHGVPGPVLAATGTTEWAIPLAPPADAGGDYTVFVKAIDVNGRESVLTARTFTHVVTRPLNVAVVGGGDVTPGFVGSTSREVGRAYTIEALPRPGQRFIGWTGGVISSANPLVFRMRMGLQFTANFAAVP